MQLRYTYRLYPTPGQRIALARVFGCARTVFNDGLRTRETARAAGLPYVTDAALSRALTDAKRTPERAWLAGVSSVVLQQALAELGTAYRNFFASAAGKRKGVRLGAPRFRSRRGRQSIRFTRNARFNIRANGRLRLPKIGDIKVTWSRALPADPTSVTIVRDTCGRFFASFVVEAGDDPLPPVETETGVDLGLTHFAVLADGEKIDNPRFLRKAEAKLKRLQRDLSRKVKGSANRVKARAVVARQHARVTDRRKDFLHKLSTRLICENQAVYVEDLAVKGLARTRLAKSVHDAGWSMFVNMLAYKAARAGRIFARIDRFAPSSQACSECAVIDGPKPLNVRAWSCTACGARHDRDVNAARNILAAGRVDRLNACGARVRPGAIPAQRVEAGTHRSVFGERATACVADTAGISCL